MDMANCYSPLHGNFCNFVIFCQTWKYMEICFSAYDFGAILWTSFTLIYANQLQPLYRYMPEFCCQESQGHVFNPQ